MAATILAAALVGGNHEKSFGQRFRWRSVHCDAGGAAVAADLPGKFEGVTIDAKLIGGQQYEALYARIGEWEKLTGAKVNVLSKKNHFELDKEIKSDIASSSVTWCVGSIFFFFDTVHTVFELIPLIVVILI